FGVEAGAAADGEGIGQFAAELLKGRAAGGAGVEEADFCSAVGEGAEDFNNGAGFFSARSGNEHGFEICGEDIEADFGLKNTLADDFFEMVAIDNEIDHAAWAGIEVLDELFEFEIGHGEIIG